MSEQRSPGLRLLVFLLMCAFAIVMVAGCKKGPQAEGGDQATVNADEAQEVDAEEGVEVASVGSAREVTSGGGRGGRGGGRGGRGGRAGAETTAADQGAEPSAEVVEVAVEEDTEAPAAEASAATEESSATGGRSGGRGGGRRGGRAETATPSEGGVVGGGAETAEEAEAATGIPEVDKMAKVRDFASIYGSTSLIEAKDRTDLTLEWVSLVPQEGKVKGQQVVLPLSLVMAATYPEEVEGYFPIYVKGNRPLGEIVSKQTITESPRERKPMDEIRAAQRERRAAIAAAAAEAAEAAATTTGRSGGRAGGRSGGGGGGRGGRGRR